MVDKQKSAINILDKNNEIRRKILDKQKKLEQRLDKQSGTKKMLDNQKIISRITRQTE